MVGAISQSSDGPFSRGWRAAREFGAAAAPGWPLIGGAGLALYAMLSTGQGRQATLAVLSAPATPAFWLTILFIVAHAFITCGAFLEATRHRDEVDGLGLRRHRLRQVIALLTALATPIGLCFFLLRFQTPLASADPQFGRYVAFAGPVLCLVLSGALFYFVCKAFRVRETTFGQIATMDGGAVRLLTIVGATSVLFGILAGYAPAVRNAVGPISLLLLAIAAYGYWTTRLVTWLRQRRWPPFLFWLGLLLALSAAYAAQRADLRPYHAIQTIKTADPARLSIDAAARAWLLDRIEGDVDIPAVVVLAEGGGLYAAYNAAGSLAGLDEADQEFFRHVFVLSGVSGGSVGVAAYLAARADIADAPTRRRVIDAFMAGDFLSPLAAGLFFRDIPYRLTPLADLAFTAAGLPAIDRARVFEAEFGRRYAAACAANGAACQARFRESLNAVISAAAPSGAAPIVLLNAARESDGRVETISNVSFAPPEDGEALVNLLDRLEPGETLPLAAAAHVSARFPIASPRALLAASRPARQNISFLDGGYADNSGAAAASGAVEALLRAAAAIDAACASRASDCPIAEGGRPLRDRLRVVVLHFHSRAIATSEGLDPGQRVDLIAEITGPVRAAVAVQARRSAPSIDAFCRLAIAPGPDSRSVCSRLPAARRTTIAKAGARTKDDADARDAVVDPTVRDGAGRRLSWISAPLDVAETPDDPRFVPLGWYLGGSAAYVAAETARRAPKIDAALRALNEAPTREQAFSAR